jgi:hypothetical protein
MPGTAGKGHLGCPFAGTRLLGPLMAEQPYIQKSNAIRVPKPLIPPLPSPPLAFTKSRYVKS